MSINKSIKQTKYRVSNLKQKQFSSRFSFVWFSTGISAVMELEKWFEMYQKKCWPYGCSSAVGIFDMIQLICSTVSVLQLGMGSFVKLNLYPLEI